ncbi:MAG: winged helix-turn-helix domain-containing protein [candidate division Zixibacteria bacterium]|nr:winged helix-turn-helix domain-containing protein [candidate division Zixibacteria bacterium]
MPPNKISLKAARKLALHCQLLDNKTKVPRGKEGIARTIEKLGYVQIDTIAVIERAHHHTLRTRRPDYNQQMLHELQANDRRLFEYWGHAASYLPMSDYRFYLPRMKRFKDPKSKWEKARLQKYGHLMKPVLERIINEGPLSSKDFEPPPGKKKGTWWDWRPAKTALEMLFWQGKLMITERRNFQRVYDLTERVLPDGVDTNCPDNNELGRFLVNRALSAYGPASHKEIIEHIHGADRDVVLNAIKDMTDSGDIIKVAISGLQKNSYYIKPELYEKSSKLRKTRARALLLSPFDNLIIQRDRTLKLFDFDYAIECYTPAAKRKFGYFVLPILYGDIFAGRLDPKADRKNKILIIRNLVFEPEFNPDDCFLQTFAVCLVDFMKFNNCESITFEKAKPAKIMRELDKATKQLI